MVFLTVNISFCYQCQKYLHMIEPTLATSFITVRFTALRRWIYCLLIVDINTWKQISVSTCEYASWRWVTLYIILHTVVKKHRKNALEKDTSMWSTMAAYDHLSRWSQDQTKFTPTHPYLKGEGKLFIFQEFTFYVIWYHIFSQL